MTLWEDEVAASSVVSLVPCCQLSRQSCGCYLGPSCLYSCFFGFITITLQPYVAYFSWPLEW